MSLLGAKVHIHGRFRGLTKRRIAQLVTVGGAKMARRATSATLVALGHGSAVSTLSDAGELNLGFKVPSRAEFVSERRFKAKLGIPSAGAEGARDYSGPQLERHSGLSAVQLGCLVLYDVLDPVEGSYSYRDLVAARTIGRLVSAGARFGKIAAAALALEQHGIDLATARLAESPWGEILQEIGGQSARLDGQLLLPLHGDDLDANEAFARAEASEEDGDLPTARRWYELAARLDRDDAVIPYNLGNVLDALGKSAEAEIAYRQAIGRSPDLADAWFNLGLLQERAQRLGEALESYAQAYLVEPTYCDALYNGAALLMRLRRFREALPLWEKIAATTPDGVVEARRLAHLCRLELAEAAARP
jgi:tetratricopeptide (TPR) repeat protein